MTNYHKIPKISPAAYIFKKALFEGLFLEGLILGGLSMEGNLCSKTNWASLIVGRKFTLFLYLKAIFQVQAPGGLIFGGAI